MVGLLLVKNRVMDLYTTNNSNFTNKDTLPNYKN